MFRQLSENELSHNIRLILTHNVFSRYFFDENNQRQTPTLFIDHSNVINAYARQEYGQFKIGITTGLLTAIHYKAREKNLDPGEIIRAVFGHELSHCAKKDFARLLKASGWFATFLVPVFIFTAQYSWLVASTILILGIMGLQSRIYSIYQENEFRCDRWGTAVSSKEAMLALLEIIHENKVSWWDRFWNHFKSHPLTEARIEQVKGF